MSAQPPSHRLDITFGDDKDNETLAVVDIKSESANDFKTMWIAPFMTANGTDYHKLVQGYKRVFVISDTPVSIKLLTTMLPVSSGEVAPDGKKYPDIYTVFKFFVTPQKPRFGYEPVRLGVKEEDFIETLTFKSGREARLKYPVESPPVVLHRTDFKNKNGEMSFPPMWNPETKRFEALENVTGALSVRYRVKGELWSIPYDFAEPVEKAVPVWNNQGHAGYSAGDSVLDPAETGITRRVRNVVLISNATDITIHELDGEVELWAPKFDSNQLEKEFKPQLISNLDATIKSIGANGHTSDTVANQLRKIVSKNRTFVEQYRQTTNVDIPDASGQPSGVKIQRINRVVFKDVSSSEQLTLEFRHG
jgi:hypothetical protein